MAPGPILWIRRGHPPPRRHRTAIVETHNMKTLKPKNPLRSAATAPLPLRMSGNVPLNWTEHDVSNMSDRCAAEHPSTNMD